MEARDFIKKRNNMTPKDSALAEGTDASQASASESENVSSSGTVTVTREEFDALTAKLQKLSNEDRSQKDKAVKGVKEQLDKLKDDVKPLLERAAEYVAAGKSPAEAIAQVNSEQDDDEYKLSVREIAQALKNGGTLPGAKASGSAQATSVNLAEVIGKYKLDGNSVEVITEITSKTFANQTEAELAAANLSLRIANKPAPSAGAASAMTTTTQSGGMNEAEASQKYTELSTLLKNPSTNTVKIAQLKKDLTDNGYPL